MAMNENGMQALLLVTLLGGRGKLQPGVNAKENVAQKRQAPASGTKAAYT